MFACSLPLVLPVVVGTPGAGVLPALPFGADANGGWFDREATTAFDALFYIRFAICVLINFSYSRSLLVCVPLSPMLRHALTRWTGAYHARGEWKEAKHRDGAAR